MATMIAILRPSGSLLKMNDLGQVVPEIDEHRRQSSEVEHRAGSQARGLDVEPELGEKGRYDHQVAIGGDRQELGDSLDESPDDRGEHGGTVMVRGSQP